MLAGVSRSSKTPTSIYLANRGYKIANIPLVVESPPPPTLFSLKHPLVVGLTTSADRLIQVRRNRLLSLNQAPETAYVDQEAVDARSRLCAADVRRQWLAGDRRHAPLDRGDRGGDHQPGQRTRSARRPNERSCSPRRAPRAGRCSSAAGVRSRRVPPASTRRPRRRACAPQGLAPRDLADALAEAKALQRVAAAIRARWCSAAIRWSRSTTARCSTSRPTAPRRPRTCGCFSGQTHELLSAAVIAERRPAGLAASSTARKLRCAAACRTRSSTPISIAEWPRSAGCVGCYRIEGRGRAAVRADRGRAISPCSACRCCRCSTLCGRAGCLPS